MFPKRSIPLLIVLGFLFTCVPLVYSQNQRPVNGKAKEKPITATMLRQLLGKNHRSEEVMMLRKSLKNHPVAIYLESILEDDVVVFQLWYANGIDIYFGKDDTVQSIFLYSGTWEKHQKYQHELPHNLTFADKIEDVKRKLGPADDTSKGVDHIPAGYFYRSKGIDVLFDSRDFAAGMATIAYIVIYEPRKD